MRARTTEPFPAWLERTRQRFERWRMTRQGHSRIPETLWASAVKAAGRYGLNPTARALGLDYYSLKKHVEAAGACGRPDRRPVVKFVELGPPSSTSTSECMLELEHPRGAKMRVQLKGMPAPDLAALSRSFWDLGVCQGEFRRRRT